MPVTPFHLGPGVAFKSVASRHVSFSVFAFTQIFIDLEALFYFAQNEGHMHRHLHTFLGAFSHILLDSMMHGDIKPFLPFSDKNGLYHILTLDQLDMLCVLSGILGLLILAGRYLLRKRRKTVLDTDRGTCS